MAEFNNCTYRDVAQNDYSEPFKQYSRIYAVCLLVYVVAGLLWWVSRRNHPYLKRRRFSLVIVSSVGVVLQTITSTFNNGFNNVPCVFNSIAFFMCLLVGFWPMAVRMIMVYTTMRYNQVLAEELGRRSGKPIEEDKTYARRKFFASKRFSFLLNYGVIFTFLGVCIPLSINLCNSLVPCTFVGASTGSLLVFIYFAAMATFAIGINIVLLLWTRNSPDPIFIRKETMRVWVACVVPGAFGLAMYSANVFEVETTAGSPWSWSVFIDLAFLLFYTVTVPFTVWLSYRPSSQYKESEFYDFLANPAGFNVFARYLVTELSLENLQFYEAVNNWKKAFSRGNDTKVQDEALRIIRMFIVSWAPREINISHKTKQDLGDVLSQARQVEVDVFDVALFEVTHLMHTDSYPRFKDSNFYKAYLNTIDPEDEALLPLPRRSTISQVGTSRSNTLQPNETSASQLLELGVSSTSLGGRLSL